MVPVKTAIQELEEGKAIIWKTTDSCETTTKDVIEMLKKLEDFERLRMEPVEILRRLMS